MTCILLTGSSRGIGAETRDLFEKRGAIVIGHASQSSMENQISADFTDASSPQLLWSKALNLSGGKIDILVNNAGIFRDLAVNASDIAWLDGWEETLRSIYRNGSAMSFDQTLAENQKDEYARK